MKWMRLNILENERSYNTYMCTANIHDNIICCASILPHVARTKKTAIKLWCRSPFYYIFIHSVSHTVEQHLHIRNCYSLGFFPPFGSSFATFFCPNGNDKSFCWFSHVYHRGICSSFDDVHVQGKHHGISITCITNLCFIANMTAARKAQFRSGYARVKRKQGKRRYEKERYIMCVTRWQGKCSG